MTESLGIFVAEVARVASKVRTKGWLGDYKYLRDSEGIDG
jgi:hypothetical protein